MEKPHKQKKERRKETDDNGGRYYVLKNRKKTTTVYGGSLDDYLSYLFSDFSDVEDFCKTIDLSESYVRVSSKGKLKVKKRKYRIYVPVHKFSEKELKDLRTCFEDADADGSGSIDKREMKKMLKKLGCYTTDKEFECLFREIDTDGSGEIEFDEFLQGVRKLLSPPSDDDLVQKFKRLDQGGKGYLNFRDIKSGFQAMNHPISDRAINDMIAVASTDGDDQVTYEEFCAIAKRPRKI